MGAVQSTSQYVVPGLVVAGGTAAYLYLQPRSTSIAGQPPSTKGSRSKKAKKTDGDSEFDEILAAARAEVEKAQAQVQPRVVAFPDVIPGTFEPENASAEGIESAGKDRKNRKRKGRKSAAAEPGVQRVEEATQTVPVKVSSAVEVISEPEAPVSKKEKKKRAKKSPSSQAVPTVSGKKTPSVAGPSTTVSAENDNAWTRVEQRRRTTSTSQLSQGDILTSDTNLGTSVTDSTSTTEEKTEDEEGEEKEPENRRTFFERMLPKPRKLGVEDMEETPLYPTVSRVIRIKPGPNEKPMQGFSWNDYEDVVQSGQGSADAGNTSADGDDDGGWGIVRSRKRTTKTPGNDSSGATPQQVSRSSSATEATTKKQRQNATKREREKADKQAAEAQRLQLLTKHKKELERAKMDEQWKSGKGKLSGGSQAVVTETGSLIWE